MLERSFVSTLKNHEECPRLVDYIAQIAAAKASSEKLIAFMGVLTAS